MTTDEAHKSIIAKIEEVYNRGEKEVDSTLNKVSHSGLSLLIVAGVLIAVMVIGDILGIASIF